MLNLFFAKTEDLFEKTKKGSKKRIGRDVSCTAKLEKFNLAKTVPNLFKEKWLDINI